MKSEVNQVLKGLFKKLLNDSKGSNPVINCYEYVQSFPYKVSKFISVLGLIRNGCGDCRHKSALLYGLYKLIPVKVRKVKVLFDWKDLPIPDDVLRILKKSGTVWLHEAVQIKVDKKWITVDSTWDPPLGRAGFPVTLNWDGKSDTLMVTNGSIKIITDAAYKMPTKVDYYEARKFAKALNAYLDRIRNL